ncbi:hypothetical protein OIE62_13825 [Streptomyces scopuliridis]|uniref:Uncharacterized protein n=1 Tax=Streptomyces scopuliridis TaxID=452529 RepID=A0ACD4ZPH5_9ACTN|nr:hypothetical protein [Streptomyces scopuliridis]WSB36086.1 hypothetical protein OG949_26760 [Streptomyces scopuliridis]WSC00390.1 hypothetical protein OG835_27570 [Streptomyces scopuliridis]WSC05999.1 hypothetical protein OIE62_13825 [Streptomyces scopuliridis]
MKWAVPLVIAGELGLVSCLLAGVAVPAPVLLGAEAVVLVLLALEAVVLRRHYARARRTGAARRDAVASAVRTGVPEPVRRLIAHEIRALASLGRWVTGRTHGVREGDHAAPYTGPQTAMMYGLLFVAVVETVALAVLIPWPVVHLMVLVLDVYTVLMVLALHAGCVTRPHVVGADGSLRIRYGSLFDLSVDAARIASVRVDRRYPQSGGLIGFDPADDGVLDLAVGGQTTVRVELTAPVAFVRPLGRRGRARVVRFHADGPAELVKALTQALTRARTAPSPTPDRPG